MQSIFRELYNGEVSPDSKNYRQDPAYIEAVRAKSGYWDSLTASLDESEMELLEKYGEARTEIDSLINFDTFSYALRLGILLMVEAFTDGSKINIESGEHEA